MTSNLEINGKVMQCIKYASECTGYSRDYITRLAREGKVVASQVGRHWYVDLESLRHYSSVKEAEQKIRQQQLSEERRLERQRALSPENAQQHVKKINLLHFPVAAFAVTGVLILSVFLESLSQNYTAATLRFSHVLALLPFFDAVPGIISVDSVAQIQDDSNSDSLELNFSQEAVRLTSLNESVEGVLLLPDSEYASTADLFSDEVQILTGASGEQFVARVDQSGGVLEKIPFVVVPVSSNNKTP